MMMMMMMKTSMIGIFYAPRTICTPTRGLKGGSVPIEAV